MTREESKSALRDMGLRATGARCAVLEGLAAMGRPMSHSEMVEHLGTDGSDQATIYRSLVKLVEVGLARVAGRAAGLVRYESVGTNEVAHLHPHFVCNDCSSVACLPELVVPRYKPEGWVDAIADAELQFVGRCPPCNAAAAVA
ncbi:MAG: Fur family ferric uptake transcriptional regulator [Myxococcota bacterium]|jgi:Fur family ferric uptake transcriptional regulator